MTKEEAMRKLETYYRKLGLENFWEGKEKRTLHNLLAASVIVEVFFNGQKRGKAGEKIDGRLKKKALVYLLKHPMLNVDGKFPDSRIPIVNEIDGEKIPEEIVAKIYKIIIYLSAKPSYTAGKIRITYPALLSPKTVPNILKQIREIIDQGKDMPVSEVLNAICVEADKKKETPTIKKEKNTITVSEQRRIISYFEEIGLLDFIKVDSQLIYSYENLKQVSQIVERYFGETISKKEKRAVLMCVLGNPFLRTNNDRKTCDLADLVNRLKMTGLEERKIFAIIINCGIEGKMLDYSYGEVLCVNDDFIGQLEENQDSKGPTEVCPETLEMAVSKSRDKEEEMGICEYYNQLGLGGIIHNTSGKLCYPESELNMARQITEGYFSGEENAGEVKKAVLRSLLSHDILRLRGQVVFDKLATVINRMRQKGVDDRDIYGFLINLSFAKSTKNYGCTYNQVLQEPKRVDDILQGEYNTVVTSETLFGMMQSPKNKRKTGVDLALLAMPTAREAAQVAEATVMVRKEIDNLVEKAYDPKEGGKGV